MMRQLLCSVALLFLLVVFQGQAFAYGCESEKYYTMIESQVRDTEFVKFLRARGVNMETGANGLLRIYAHEKPDAIPAIVKFLGLMKTWSDVALGNMVNIDTAWDGTGKKPYQRKTFSINKNGNASVLIDEKTLPIKRYLPVHSYADAEGFVLFPNVNLVLEIIQLENASREYGLAERLLERCMPGNYIPDSATQMMQQNTIHFREMEELRGRLDRIERRLDTLTPSR